MHHLTKPNRPSILHVVKRSIDATGDPEYLSRADVSKLLGVSPNTVTRWAREGKLACQVTLGGHHRFERVMVESLRKSLTRGGDAA